MSVQNIDYDLLHPLVPFKDLLPGHLQQLIEESTTVYLFEGDILFEKGQYDDVHYYLLTGQLHSDSGHTFSDSGLFPIVDQQPRPYRVHAGTQSTVLKVSRERLDELLTWGQAAEYLMVELASQRHRDEDADWLSTILKSNLFLKVPPTNVAKIIDCVDSRLADRGEAILRQGELGDCCYFLKEGEAEVTRFDQASGEWRHVANIGPGRCFGEEALLSESVRNANVTMRCDGVLLTLKKMDFLQLLREPEAATCAWTELQKLSADDVLIDMRTESEYARGHLQSAVNIPLNLLQLKSRMLKPERNCLLYCDTGRRSATAACFLRELGYKASAFSGGLDALAEESRQPQLCTNDYVLQSGLAVAGQ